MKAKVYVLNVFVTYYNKKDNHGLPTELILQQINIVWINSGISLTRNSKFKN